jgi:hypothetical protein
VGKRLGGYTMKQTTKKSKKSKALSKKQAVTEASGEKCTEITDPNDQREEKFISLLLMGHSVHSAALKAGFSKSYAKAGIYQRLRTSENLQRKIMGANTRWAQNYRKFCMASLPEIQEIESGALEEYRKDPSLAIDKPTLLKQLKQTANVLAPDSPQAPKINIQKLQIGQMMVAENLTRGLSGSPDLEALDVTPGTVDSDLEEG